MRRKRQVAMPLDPGRHLAANQPPKRLRALALAGVLLACLSLPAMPDAAHAALPSLDGLWDFDQPQASEARFRDRLAQPGQALAASLEARTQLARALGLQGRFAEGHAELDRVDQALLSHPELRRVALRGLLERGRLFHSAGEKAKARPLFEEAWALGQAIHEEGLAVDAAHMVAIVATGAEAQAWNLKALALAEASAQPEAQAWRGSLLNNLGWACHEAGDFEAALGHFQKALAFREAKGQVGATEIARWSVGRCLRSLGRLSEALALQEALKASMAQRGAPPDGYVSEELGECLLALGREAEARPHLQQAHALLAQDAWFAQHEAARLARLKALGAR